VTGRHTASIGLNEAEAAAVETAIHPNLNANGSLNTEGYKVWVIILRGRR